MIWEELNKRAYVPYSGTPKSCIVLGNKGGYFAGVRIECVSFPLTIPAVQAACCICLSEQEIPVKLFVPHVEFEQLGFWKTEYKLEVSTIIEEYVDLDALKNLGIDQPVNELSYLKSLLDHAVIPNSDFPVSCLLNTEQKTFTGVNIEVSDWTMGLCAERVAIAKAISAGIQFFSEIVIHTKLGEFSSPCGACRQVLHEHMPLKKAKLHHADNSFSQHYITDFLPFSFASSSLTRKI